MRRFLKIAPLLAVSVLGACIIRPVGQQQVASNIPPVSGSRRALYSLEYIDVEQGRGAMAEPRKCVYAHYTGWLQNGMKFDSSRDSLPTGTPRDPIAVLLGARRVIAGWEHGFDGMRVGGQRRLFIPYQLAYGETGRGEIPPRAPLVFDIELMAVADTVVRSGPTEGPPQCPEWSQVPR